MIYVSLGIAKETEPAFFMKQDACKNTDKRTDVWSQNFITWKINFGLLAVALAGLWEKGVWVDSEQLFWLVFSIFHGQKIKKNKF